MIPVVTRRLPRGIASQMHRHQYLEMAYGVTGLRSRPSTGPLSSRFKASLPACESSDPPSSDPPSPDSSGSDPPCSDPGEPTDQAHKLEMAQKILQYEFHNKRLLWKALQAPGSNIMTPPTVATADEGNKSLAIVGDAVATLLIRLECYRSKLTIGTAKL
ncbi:hypothetical protein ONZ43_g7709 [Nemania bipapillata]|uniref:Uncharacterized protein n=1 Tax=Nemania bipapillata TaxID=110536 RepID=A0ACC2HPS4_9PEZI|nr:hypothetical protein ONZ43_g7709 [Nemania bipapillata]